MRIDITQQDISIGDKYSILVNDQQTYYASGAVLTLLAEIKLTKEKGGEPLLVIKKKFSPFAATYTIKLSDGTMLDFTTVSILQMQYQCVCGEDTYDIYGNRGRKYSIFKNDVQIGYFVEAAVTMFMGDNYTIYANSDCDKELVIAFCLIIDNYANNDSRKSSININFNLGIFGLRKFDSDWEPNDGWLPDR